METVEGAKLVFFIMAEKEDNVLTEGDNTSRNGEENFKEEIKVSKQFKRVEKERENYA